MESSLNSVISSKLDKIETSNKNKLNNLINISHSKSKKKNEFSPSINKNTSYINTIRPFAIKKEFIKLNGSMSNIN